MNGVVLQKLETRSQLPERSKVASSPAMVILTWIRALVDAVRQSAQRLPHLDLREIVQARLRRREDRLAVLAAELDDTPLAGLGRRDLGEKIALARFGIPNIGLEQ